MTDWKRIAKLMRRNRNYYRRVSNLRSEELYRIRKYAKDLFDPITKVDFKFLVSDEEP